MLRLVTKKGLLGRSHASSLAPGPKCCVCAHIITAIRKRHANTVEYVEEAAKAWPYRQSNSRFPLAS